jgi:hypothetical protein
LKTNNGEWWDSSEKIGFDAPPELKAQGIVDGDIIEVYIVNIRTGDVVFKGEFVYRDCMFLTTM